MPIPSLSSKTEVDFQNMEKEDNGKLLKTPAHERLKIDDIISPKPPRPAPPAAADRKAAGFMIDSWKEEVKRLEIVKKSGIKASRSSSSNGSSDRSGRGCRRRTSDALRNLLRCKTVDTNETAVTAAEKRGARKAVFEPNCSQCGKSFRPEKLHFHMKTCRGLTEKGSGGGFKREKKMGQMASGMGSGPARN